jgi:hypothetical protein
VFADVTDNMTIAREEIFDPVLAAMPFEYMKSPAESGAFTLTVVLKQRMHEPAILIQYR